MSTTPGVPEAAVQQFSQEAELIVSELRAIEVTDQESYDLAGEVLVRRAAFKKRIEEFFEPMKEQANKLHKTICSSERKILTGPEGRHDLAEQATRNNMAVWWKKQEDARRQKELDAIAEQRKKDDAARTLAAETARQLGASPEAVDVVKREFVPPPPPKVVPTATKAPGITYREDWTWRFETSEAQAVEAILKAACGVKAIKNRHLLSYLLINQRGLNGDATTKKNTASVPGVIFYQQPTTVVRGGR